MTESGQEDLARRFEQDRARLWAVAFRMLGASGEADEAVQEAWLRLARSEAEEIENLPGWLTTVVARICLDMLRARKARREEPLGPHVPDPIVSPVEGGDPEPTAPDVGLERQREVVDAFFEASREGDFEALVAVLHPEVVLRSDGGEARPSANHVIRGAAAVAGRAITFADLSPFVRPVLVNGVAGVLVAPRDKPFAVMAFTVAGGRVVAIDALADQARLERLETRGGVAWR